MDDDFMTRFFENDKECTQFVLQTILDNKKWTYSIVQFHRNKNNSWIRKYFTFNCFSKTYRIILYSCKFIFYEPKNNSEIVLNENNILDGENNSKIMDKIIDEINKYYIKDSEQEDNSNDYILNSGLFFLNFLIKDQTELENHFNIIFSIKSNYNFKELEKKINL